MDRVPAGLVSSGGHPGIRGGRRYPTLTTDWVWPSVQMKMSGWQEL